MKKAKPKKRVQVKSEKFGPDVMPGDVFKAALEKLYGTPQCQSAFARLIDVSDRTVRSWIAGTYAVPKIVAQLVNLMLKTKTQPDELRAT
jgi:plasmid maintenance system antidote protein VapI